MRPGMKHVYFLTAVLLVAPYFSSAQTSTAPDVVPLPDSYQVQNLGGEMVGDFVVGPGKHEVTLTPGESVETQITVSNRTGETKIFTLTVEDATGSDDPDRPVVLLGDDRGPYTLKDYIQIPLTEFAVQHNERIVIPVTVSLPADAEPGGRYGSVLVSTASLKDESAPDDVPRSTIISRIGTLYFVTTPGLEDQSGNLEQFSTVEEKTWFARGPINFGILFKNTGSVHLNPYGEMSITNMTGQQVGFMEIDPWFALPNSTRLREVSWDRDYLFGRYTATVSINRGYDDVIDTASWTFWVIDWLKIVYIFIAVTLIVALIRFFTTRFEFKRKDLT